MNSILPSKTIILDGHSCSGKSTVAQELSRLTGAKYLKPIEAELGNINYYLYKQSEFKKLISFRSIVYDYYLDIYKNYDCIFDRFEPSMVSLLPKKKWPQQLQFSKMTYILWCDTNTTISRLELRGRNIWKKSEHDTFVKLFHEIAERYNIKIIDTKKLSIHEAAQEILKHAL